MLPFDHDLVVRIAPADMPALAPKQSHRVIGIDSARVVVAEMIEHAPDPVAVGGCRRATALRISSPRSWVACSSASISSTHSPVALIERDLLLHHVVGELMLEDLRAEALRDLDRAIGRERIDQDQLVAEPRAAEALPDVLFLVARDHDERDLWLFPRRHRVWPGGGSRSGGASIPPGNARKLRARPVARLRRFARASARPAETGSRFGSHRCGSSDGSPRAGRPRNTPAPSSRPFRSCPASRSS